MSWKSIFSIIFVMVVIIFLIVYWFVPIGEIRFNSGGSNSNFSLGNSTSMQFYNNMRFPSSEVSYKIYECGLQKQNDMQEAFEIISNRTSLNFNGVESDEEISVTCSEEVKMDEELFIAGEGGPTKIIQTSLFSVILKGKILLIKDSKCSTPNVAIHELFHVLGFEHSENKNNIMYYMSRCGQEIGEDNIDLINRLYETPSRPDLSLENVSATVSGTYLDFEVSVRNNGLAVSDEAELDIYADGKSVKTLKIKPLEIGSGLKISLENLWMPKRNPSGLKFVIKSDFEELDKVDNEVVLSI